MGKGFLFEARQKRFTFDEEDISMWTWYSIIVCCNAMLLPYRSKEEKISQPSRSGQMQMYVNYFDRYTKQDLKANHQILLCKKRNDALVDLTLQMPIFASAYELYPQTRPFCNQK